VTGPDTSAVSLLDRLRQATIGRYDIYAELGSGGMATVFLARDLALDRKVAIKVMSPALASTPEAIERFRREARVAAALSHPHIIPIHAIGEEPGIAYYVMKHVEGRTLDSVLRDDGAPSIAFVRTVLVEIGNALHYAHQRGVVHRDVKPANIMLDTDGWLVVTDFGIAKRDDAAGLTQSGTIIGTPFYMSPEQFNGQPVTGSADQYALGIVAYELLAGRTPFGGPSLGEVMKGHLLDPVPPLRAVRADIPDDLDACITRMLDKDADKRFATLAEMTRALGGLSPSAEAEMRTQIVELARTGAAQQPQMAVPVSPLVQRRPAAATVPLAERPPRRSRVAVIGVGVLGLAAAALFVADRAGLRSVDRGAAPVTPQAAAGPSAAAAPRPAAQDPVNVPPVSGPPADPPAPAPTQPTPEERAVAVAESLGAAAAQAVRDSIAAAGRTLRDRILNQAGRAGAGTGGGAAAALGAVRIGSATPGATLRVNARAPRPIPNRNIQTLPLPAGRVRLVIAAPNCAPWDSTVTVVAGQRMNIGMRTLRCRR
jgi:serine/threonine-protein kinase